MDDIFNGYGVEVSLQEPDDFLRVKETLTRIGIPDNKNKRLYQSCHILHKGGKYAIVHFKELLSMDGRKSTLEQEDYDRRNMIAKLLEEWKLVEILDDIEDPGVLKFTRVLPFSEKNDWTLVPKYVFGKKGAA